MRVVVIGVGALGSNMLLAARNAKVDWRIVDFDKVESKNTMSQFHTKMGLGKNKTLSLAQSLNGLWGVKVDTVPHKLTTDNVHQLLHDADLVVDCLDNAAGRIIIQDYVRKHNIPCLHGALAPNGVFGRIVWDEFFQIDSEAGLGQATCEDGEHLPFIMNVACHMANSVLVYIKHQRKVGAEVHPNGFIRT